jgi:hypothetical protein
MDILIYLGILVGIIGIAFLGVYLKKKFNLKDSDVQFLQLILEICDYITSKIEFKYQEGVSVVVEYCLQAVSFVEMFDDIEDLEQKIIICKEKAIEACVDNGFEVDNGLIEIIDQVIDYIFDNYDL